MSSSTDVEALVIDLIRRQLHSSNPRLDPRARLVDDLGADSLTLVELTCEFEETFDIDIPDDEVVKIRTVRDAVISVEKCLRERAAP